MRFRHARHNLTGRATATAGAWSAAAVAGVLMVVVLTVQTDVVHLVPTRFAPPVRIGVLAVAVLSGALAVHYLLDAVFRHGTARGALGPVREVVAWIAYAMLGLFLTSALGVDLSGFLLGSAVLGVIIGAAAQSSLANLFAGLVINVARPYRVAEWVSLRATSTSGVEVDGVVVEIGPMYTTLISDDQRVVVPNSVAMVAIARTDRIPVRVAVTLTLPGHVGIADLQRGLADALEREHGDRVAARPRELVLAGEATLTCDVQVRSHRPVGEDEVVSIARRVAAGAEPRSAVG